MFKPSIYQIRRHALAEAQREGGYEMVAIGKLIERARIYEAYLQGTLVIGDPSANVIAFPGKT